MGFKGLCLDCQQGNITDGRFRLKEYCQACGNKIERNSGDSWAFLIFIDRLVFLLPEPDLGALLGTAHRRLPHGRNAWKAPHIATPEVLQQVHHRGNDWIARAASKYPIGLDRWNVG